MLFERRDGDIKTHFGGMKLSRSRSALSVCFSIQGGPTSTSRTVIPPAIFAVFEGEWGLLEEVALVRFTKPEIPYDLLDDGDGLCS